MSKLDLHNKKEIALEKDGPMVFISEKESTEDNKVTTAERKTPDHFTNKIGFNDNTCQNNESKLPLFEESKLPLFDESKLSLFDESKLPLFDESKLPLLFDESKLPLLLRNTELIELFESEKNVFNEQTKLKALIEDENLTSSEKHSSLELNKSADIRSRDLHISCEEQSSFERFTILENIKHAVEISSDEFIETDVVEISSNEFIETGVVEINSDEFMAANVVEISSDEFIETDSIVETNSVEFVAAGGEEINSDIFTATDFVEKNSCLFTANIGEPTLPFMVCVERPDVIIETNAFNEEIEKHFMIEPFLECTTVTTLSHIHALKLPEDYPLNAAEKSGELAFRKNESDFNDVNQTDHLNVFHNCCHSQLKTGKTLNSRFSFLFFEIKIQTSHFLKVFLLLKTFIGLILMI